MNRKILIVDDDREVCNMIKHYFNKRKLKVIIATSAEEALAKLIAEKPAMVLLDIFLPEMDGIKCLSRIKELDKDVKVIMVTCDTDIDTTKTAIELGAIDYVTKPFSLDTLGHIVKKHLIQK